MGLCWTDSEHIFGISVLSSIRRYRWRNFCCNLSHNDVGFICLRCCFSHPTRRYLFFLLLSPCEILSGEWSIYLCNNILNVICDTKNIMILNRPFSLRFFISSSDELFSLSCIARSPLPSFRRNSELGEFSFGKKGFRLSRRFWFAAKSRMDLRWDLATAISILKTRASGRSM